MILFRKYKEKTLRIIFCFSPFYTYICCFLFLFFPILPKRKKNKANTLRSFYSELHICLILLQFMGWLERANAEEKEANTKERMVHSCRDD